MINAPSLKLYCLFIPKDFDVFLLAAVSLSNDYFLGALLFTTRRGVLEKSFFNREAGKETRKKIWSDFVAEQNEE